MSKFRYDKNYVPKPYFSSCIEHGTKDAQKITPAPESVVQYKDSDNNVYRVDGKGFLTPKKIEPEEEVIVKKKYLPGERLLRKIGRSKKDIQNEKDDNKYKRIHKSVQKIVDNAILDL
jgi:hypothetical protein